MSVGPIGVDVPSPGVFAMLVTTGVVPLQVNVTVNPETCGYRPVEIAGLRAGPLNP